MSIRILIAEDNHLLRAGLRALLSAADPSHQVVGEADNGARVLELAAELTPDIVLMDISMPGMNGIETTARLTARYSSIRVIMLSSYCEEQYVQRALKAGARGYVLKNVSIDNLRSAVAAVARGDSYFSSEVTALLSHWAGGPPGGFDKLATLSGRQREVLQLVAEGGTTKEIAHHLALSPKTVDCHRAELMRRLDIRDIAGLVRFAIQAGVVRTTETAGA